MLNLFLQSPVAFFIIFPALLVSLVIHEFAHAWTADKLGDPTPRHQGRLTLDPRAHLDPLGTLALLFTPFGWGKPVEFDPYNLRNPLRDTALIAIAGPISNFVIAGLAALALNVASLGEFAESILSVLININVALGVFNLVPVYPLDGSKVLLAVLPRDTAEEYDNFMRRYGMLVLLLLIFPWAGGVSPVSQLISPVINLITTLLGT